MAVGFVAVEEGFEEAGGLVERDAGEELAPVETVLDAVVVAVRRGLNECVLGG